MITRADILNTARGLLGVKWVHMGRDPVNGIDCGGLLVCIARAHGIPYTDFEGWYSPLPDGHTLVEVLRKSLVEIPVEQATLGSVLVFGMPGMAPKGRERELPQHIGLLSEIEPARRMIHSSNRSAYMRVIETMIPARWEPNISHAFDFPGVEV